MKTFSTIRVLLPIAAVALFGSLTPMPAQAQNGSFGSQFRRLGSVPNPLRVRQVFTLDGEIWGSGNRGWNPFRNAPVYLVTYQNGYRVSDRQVNCNNQGYFRFDIAAPAQSRVQVKYELQFRGQGNVRACSVYWLRTTR